MQFFGGTVFILGPFCGEYEGFFFLENKSSEKRMSRGEKKCNFSLAVIESQRTDESAVCP